MNVRYRFHPGDYELGENEKFYSGMEAKGWRLVKRGQRLSKFTPAEPSQARYRIEVFHSGFLGEPGMGEEQLAVFEDCGWEYIYSRGFLHIFRAPQGSDAPEFYADPRQQAATLKGVRRALLWSSMISAFIIAACVLTIVGLSGGLYFQWETVKRFVQVPALFLSYGFWLLTLLYQFVRGTWKLNRTYFQLKKGKPLDHNPRTKPLHRIISRTLPALAAVCLLALAVQLLGTQSRDLPMEPDGPYVLLRDLGWDGERTTQMFSDRESGYTYTRSPLSDYWEVFETVDGPSDSALWLYQYVYRLKIPALRDTLVQALMEDSVFARGAENFHPVDVDGLDAAWSTGRLEVVAVKGDYVFYAEYLTPSPGSAPDLTALLEAWSSTHTFS